MKVLKALLKDAKVAIIMAAGTGTLITLLLLISYAKAAEKGISEAVQELVSAE